MDKGIATKTLFLILIGVIVLVLVVAIVIINSTDFGESKTCKSQQQEYCFRWQFGDKPDGWTVYDDCPSAPTENICENLGYDIPDE